MNFMSLAIHSMQKSALSTAPLLEASKAIEGLAPKAVEAAKPIGSKVVEATRPGWGNVVDAEIVNPTAAAAAAAPKPAWLRALQSKGGIATAGLVGTGLAGGIGHHTGYQSGGQAVGPAAWREGLEAGRLASQSARDNAGFFSRLFGQGGQDVAGQTLARLAGPQMTQAVVNQILARQ